MINNSNASRKLILVMTIIMFAVMMTSCTGRGGEKLLGEWVSTDDFEENVLIEKAGKDYFWNDSDGKFPADFKDGKLSIEVGLGKAIASLDKESGILKAYFMGTEYNFISKDDFLKQIKAFTSDFFNATVNKSLLQNVEQYEDYFTDEWYNTLKEVKDYRVEQGLIRTEKISGKHNLEFRDIKALAEKEVMVLINIEFESKMKSLSEEHLLQNNKMEAVIRGEELMEVFLKYQDNQWKIYNLDTVEYKDEYQDDNGKWVTGESWKR